MVTINQLFELIHWDSSSRGTTRYCSARTSSNALQWQLV